MRCPKCGYNSFDYLDSCKKCGKELLEYKQRYGIKSVLFPGLMKQSLPAGEEFDSSLVEAAPAAVTTAGSAAAGFAVETVKAEASTSEADDFGFDFMGESEEEDDLSFDELFEEAPVDEDLEEALPSPSAAAEKDSTEFSFDSAADDVAAVVSESDLDNDFGFDLDDPGPLASGTGPTDDLAADDFELPPVDEEGFDFNPDEVELEEPEEKVGTKGDPKGPFELPESSQVEEAPEQQRNSSTDQALLISAADELLQRGHGIEIAAVAADDDLATAELQSVFHDPFAEDDALPLTAVDESLAVALAEEVGRADESVAAVSALVIAGADPADKSSIVAGDTVDSDVSLTVADDEQPEPSLLPPVVSRVAAFFCDLALLSTVAVSFIVAAEAVMSGSSDRLLPSLTTLIDLSIPYFLVLFALAFGYFTLFHFLVGQTPGKMLAGLRVETLEGDPLALSQAFLRSVGGLLQLLPVGLGYLVALLSADQRGWNDRLAGTRLISLKADLKV